MGIANTIDLDKKSGVRKLTRSDIQNLIDRLREIIDDLYLLEGDSCRGLFADEEDDLKAAIRRLQKKLFHVE